MKLPQVVFTPEQRAYYKKFHPDLARDRLEYAGKVSIDDRNLERLSAVAALYLYDVAAEFEPPTAWDWKREAPLTKQGKPRLTREMEKRRREWLVDEVKKVWRACGGTGRGGYYSSSTRERAARHTGPLVELIVELLDQFDAPPEQRSRSALCRMITGKR